MLQARLDQFVGHKPADEYDQDRGRRGKEEIVQRIQGNLWVDDLGTRTYLLISMDNPIKIS
jgi:hypothetical protein